MGLLYCLWGGVACVRGENGLDDVYVGVRLGTDVFDTKFDY